MNAKTLDALASGVVDVVKKSLAEPKAHIQSLEQRVTELQQQLLDLTALVHLMHDAGKVDPSNAAAGRDVH